LAPSGPVLHSGDFVVPHCKQNKSALLDLRFRYR
jgi:hypothetical protein